MVMKLLFKPFSFTDPKTRYFTNILSGETGSGKSSLIMQLLYLLLTVKDVQMPFKRVYVNIDGFDFDYFNSLAKTNGLDVQFFWLDMHEVFAFAKEERDLYQVYSTDGEGTIAKRIRKNISEEYIKYFSSLIICDEADNYLGTDLSKEVKAMSLGFSNFMKFKRHHHIEMWLLTQKFQNLNSQFYNNGAVNRFLRVRSMFFSFGKSKILEHWVSSDTSKKDNRLESYWYQIEDDLYNRYDVGANITTGDGNVKKLKWLFLILLAGVVFSLFVGYKILGKYFTSDSDIKKETQTPKQIIIKDLVNGEPVNQVQPIFNVVKCVTFKNTSNCYFRNNFTSISNDFIAGLIDQNLSNIRVLYSFQDVSYISVDDTGLSFIFNQIQRGKNNEDNN